MKQRVSVFIIALIGAIISTAHAQHYNRSVGINLGATVGANYKHFLGQKSAIEGALGYQINDNSVMATFAYQYHIKIVDNFNFYVGGGINIGAADVSSHNGAKFALGIDPNIGFEYKFNRVPLALGIDYMPQIDFFRGTSWEIVMLKVRFCF